MPLNQSIPCAGVSFRPAISFPFLSLPFCKSTTRLACYLFIDVHPPPIHPVAALFCPSHIAVLQCSPTNRSLGSPVTRHPSNPPPAEATTAAVRAPQAARTYRRRNTRARRHIVEQADGQGQITVFVILAARRLKYPLLLLLPFSRSSPSRFFLSPTAAGGA